jgi:hypothetical protein
MEEEFIVVNRKGKARKETKFLSPSYTLNNYNDQMQDILAHEEEFMSRLYKKMHPTLKTKTRNETFSTEEEFIDLMKKKIFGYQYLLPHFNSLNPPF